MKIGRVVATIKNEKVVHKSKRGGHGNKEKIRNSPIKGLGANSAKVVALFPPSTPGSIL